MGRSERFSRRHVLTSIGVGTTVLLGGCASTSDDPKYESGDANETDGDPRTAGEMVAAEALAQREANTNASPLRSLALEDHEYVIEGRYKGPTVQGTVRNTGEEPLRFVEVRVRVYDDTGAQRGRYLDSTGDLAAGATWQFEVILLTAAADIARYDVATLGVPE